ncbi:MAG: hypothetical protein EP350_02815 [Alphaproteobacteria bacterium]|nr:MAG: hypothetical protein EP350_02815 [Alphaproteobacteria bacterium]
MKKSLVRGAAALPLLLCATPVLADESPKIDGPNTGEEAPIVVSYVPLHPAAGMMNEHMHDGGEFMLGLRYSHDSYRGANQSGTDAIADGDIYAAGYGVRASRMDMDMVMLDIMYAPNDQLTFMIMPHWMRHEMTMVGINPMNTGMDMGGMDMTQPHSGLPFGETMTHSTEGFSDTLVSGSLRLARSPSFNAHVTIGLWLPTGRVDRTNPDGTFVHYGMQSGSGTWDIELVATILGAEGAFGWGAQASYRWRTEEHNASGFSFGDKTLVTSWASHLVGARASATARLSWEHEGQILGHYNAAHRHASPSDRQTNYGGDKVLVGLGLNLALPFSGAKPPQIGFEAAVPVYQNLNGIQLPEDWRLSLSLTKTL